MCGKCPVSLLGLFMLCTMIGCRTQAPGLQPVPERRTGQWIRIDSLATYGARLPVALDAGDTNRDGLPDLLAGSSIYLNPGGDLTGLWKRIDVNPETESLVLVNVDGDGHPDLIGLAVRDIYWLEALDPEGIQWSSMKVARLPAGAGVDAIAYADFDGDGRKAWTLVAADSLYWLDVPMEPEDGAWRLSRFSRRAFPDRSFPTNLVRMPVDLDGDGDSDTAGVDSSGVLSIWRNDAGRMP